MLVTRTLVIAFCLVPALACAAGGEDDWGEKGDATSVTEKPIELVLIEQTDALMSVPGVVGTALGECDGTLCIKVLVAERTPALLAQIPSSLDGYPLVVEETGLIRAVESQ